MTSAEEVVVVDMGESPASGETTSRRDTRTGPALASDPGLRAVRAVGGTRETGALFVQDELGADAAVGVNLQEEGVSQAAVDDVRLADAAPEAVQARLHFGDHARVDDA